MGQTCPVGYCPSQQCHCTPCNQNPQPGQPAGTCSHLHCLYICVRCGPVIDIQRPIGISNPISGG